MINSDELRNRLDAQDHKQILQECGFDLNGQNGPKLSGILGPTALGEGENGNFSVDLERGLVKDWGSTDYDGSSIDVVMDVQGLTFPEALEWIVGKLNFDVESNGSNNGQSATTSSSESNRPPNEESEPEPVVSHDQVRRWHERLMSDTDAAQAARSYLTDERGLDTGALQAAHIGLAHTPDDGRGSWWIMIPVPDCRGGNPPSVVAVKGFAFIRSSAPG